MVYTKCFVVFYLGRFELKRLSNERFLQQDCRCCTASFKLSSPIKPLFSLTIHFMGRGKLNYDVFSHKK